MPTHEGYRLEELALTLFYLDGFGFGSLEGFKRAYSEECGVLMGRTQSPSLLTLRRFLHKVRKLGQGEALIDEFALTCLKCGLAAWGVMYIDGHFLPYDGLYPISKGWHGVRQMPMKGSYNFLAVDERFAPWLFLIRSSSEDLLQKIPELIEQAKRIGEQAGVSQERLDRLIVIFDREGYSAELYRYLEGRDEGAGKRRALFISWAKYSDKWVNDLAEEQLDKLPSEIRFDEAHAGEKLLKLNHEKKRSLDCIKVFVCNLKAEMCRLLLKHYDWQKEVVPALATIVERTGYVKLEGGRLEVTRRRFTDREIDYAARHPGEDLNRMQPVSLDKFHLPLRFHVQ